MTPICLIAHDHGSHVKRSVCSKRIPTPQAHIHGIVRDSGMRENEPQLSYPNGIPCFRYPFNHKLLRVELARAIFSNWSC